VVFPAVFVAQFESNFIIAHFFVNFKENIIELCSILRNAPHLGMLIHARVLIKFPRKTKHCCSMCYICDVLFYMHTYI